MWFMLLLSLLLNLPVSPQSPRIYHQYSAATSNGWWSFQRPNFKLKPTVQLANGSCENIVSCCTRRNTNESASHTFLGVFVVWLPFSFNMRRVCARLRLVWLSGSCCLQQNAPLCVHSVLHWEHWGEYRCLHALEKLKNNSSVVKSCPVISVLEY